MSRSFSTLTVPTGIVLLLEGVLTTLVTIYTDNRYGKDSIYYFQIAVHNDKQEIALYVREFLYWALRNAHEEEHIYNLIVSSQEVKLIDFDRSTNYSVQFPLTQEASLVTQTIIEVIQEHMPLWLAWLPLHHRNRNEVLWEVINKIHCPLLSTERAYPVTLDQFVQFTIGQHHQYSNTPKPANRHSPSV